MALRKTLTPSSRLAKQALNDVLRERLRQGQGNLRRAADKLKLDYQRLRQDLFENKFAPGDLKILCKAAGLATHLNELESRYQFTLRKGVRGFRRPQEKHREMLAAPLAPKDSGLADTFDYYSARQEEVARVVDSAEENIKGLFHGLGAYDSLFLTILDQEPIHWQEDQKAADLPHVATAIRNGALIAYLHPNQTLYDELKDFGCPVVEPGFLRVRFKDFTEILKLHLPANERYRVAKQIACIEFKWPVLGVPFFRFALYHHSSTSATQPMVWATVTVPMMIRTRNSDRQPNYVILELNKSATTFLHGFCRMTITTALNQTFPVGGDMTALRHLFKRLFPDAELP